MTSRGQHDLVGKDVVKPSGLVPRRARRWVGGGAPVGWGIGLGVGGVPQLRRGEEQAEEDYWGVSGNRTALWAERRAAWMRQGNRSILTVSLDPKGNCAG